MRACCCSSAGSLQMYAVGINEMAQSVVEDVTNKVKEVLGF